jgi:MFS family permease
MVNAYLVPFGGFLLLGGRAGDLLGRRRVLVTGTGAFTLASLGLILGGVLVTAVGWRWIFLVNIPVGAVVVAAALRLLPADAADVRSAAAVGPDGSRKRGGFDVGGAISVTAGTSLLAYAVVQTGSHGWGSARTVVLLAVAAALIGYFLLHEHFVASSPLMPLTLWRNRSVKLQAG